MEENLMDLFVETLTGTAFELHVSPFETVISIKAKIQFLEGIPISQQHLIWNSQELEDDLCLHDYNIMDGTTLKLVLGMRGGPVNTHRVSVGENNLKDLTEFVEERRDQIKTGGASCQPFTVVVFHDGDKVHMYTVLDNSEEMKCFPGSIRNSSPIPHLSEDDTETDSRQKENQITREKMTLLQEKIKSLTIVKPRRKTCSTNPGMLKSAKRSILDRSAFHYISSPGERLRLPPLQPNASMVCKGGNISSSLNEYDISQLNSADKPVLSTNLSSSHNSLPNISVLHCRRHHSSAVKSFNNKVIKNSISKIDIQNESTQEQSDNSSSNSMCKCEVGSIVLPVGNVKADVQKTEQNVDKADTHNANVISLPCIPSSQRDVEVESIKKSFLDVVNKNSDLLTLVSSPSYTSKYNQDLKPKYMFRYASVTSNPSLARESFLELDQWFENRPKTTPQGSLIQPLETLIHVNDSWNSPRSLLHENLKKEKIGVKNKHLLPNHLSTERTITHIDSPLSDDLNMRWNMNLSLPSAKDQMQLACTSQTVDHGKIVSSGLNASQQREFLYFNKSKNFGKHILPKSYDQESKLHVGQKLPPVRVKKKSYKKCTWCNKKTGLATSYSCRCGKNFCATHRYAELHHCSYDYKSEGRRFLQQSNPVITASKLPKI